jgi:hypothetical protein
MSKGEHVSKWTFFGRILPERVPLRIEGPEFIGVAKAAGIRYRAKVKIADGQFIVPVTIENGQTDIYTLRNMAENNIRCLTDLIGYAWRQLRCRFCVCSW